MKLDIFFDVVKSIYSKISLIKKSVKTLTKEAKKLFAAIEKFMKSTIELFFRNPVKREDYIKFSEILISKRVIALTVILGGIVLFTTTKVIYPWAEGILWTPTITFNSQKYHEYSGEAKVVNIAGGLIYKGALENGIASGKGTQYDINGNLHYKGNFSDGEHSGEGELYENNSLRYKGDFIMSMFEGKGNLYDSNENIISSGNFENGLENGEEKEYISENIMIYQGSFVNGYQEGTGISFEADGKTIKYQGEFSLGEYNGKGRLYQEGTLIYSGDFAENKYSGEGVLFNPENGIMIYKGSMSKGMLNGFGEQFDKETGHMTYKGEFVNNKRDGTGELFDKLGFVSYKGAFHDNYIDMKSYLGSTKEDIEFVFGQAGISDNDDLVYRHRDIVFVMKMEVCEKILISLKEEIFGIIQSMDKNKVHNLMGKPDFTANYPIIEIHSFNYLGIDVKIGDKLYGDKYIIDNYYVKVYYTNHGEKVIAVKLAVYSIVI